MELDERFSRLAKDPSYKKIAKKERKIQIDSRFEKMFTDERFQIKCTTDKRGRMIDLEEVEDLRNFYDIDPEKSGDELNVGEKEVKECEEKQIKKKKTKKKGKLLASVTGRSLRLPHRPSIGIRRKSLHLKNSQKREEAEVTNADEDPPAISFDDIRGETLPDDSDSDDNDTFDDIRGETSDNSDTDEGDNFDEDVDGDNIIHGWGELDDNVKYIDNAEARRFAVCNCDWDKIGANDLYVLFNSFKPVEGTIKSVKIYPSDFGIERMKEEKTSGPKELGETAIESDDENKENEEGSRFHMEKLREYQLNRLKYYYAVVECNSADTANKLYEELDGQEYEMSATRLDLRFIPDDTTFDREPTSVADGTTQLKNYEPVSSHNTALQQSTVRLTWDEMDTKRTQATMRKFTNEDIENMDFKDYLASSSSEDEEDDFDSKIEIIGSEDENPQDDDKLEKPEASKKIEIYKKLMQEIEAKEEKDNNNKQDIEVSFGNNVDNDTDKISSFAEISVKNSSRQEDEENQDSPDSDVEDDEISSAEDNENTKTDIKDKKEDFNDPFFTNPSLPDKSSEKGKSKKKRKRRLNESETETEGQSKAKNELELLLLDESEDKKHFNLKSILDQEKASKSKKKRRKDKDLKVADDFKIDVSDTRFNALYSSHLFALDPSEPNFKHTKATEAIIEESQRQRKKNDLNNSISNTGKDQIDSDLNGLLKSVKSKTELHKWKKEKKKLKI